MSKQELTVEDKIDKVVEYLKPTLEKVLSYSEQPDTNYAKQAAAKMWIRNTTHLITSDLRRWTEDIYPLEEVKPVVVEEPKVEESKTEETTEKKAVEKKEVAAKKETTKKAPEKKSMSLKEALKKTVSKIAK